MSTVDLVVFVVMGLSIAVAVLCGFVREVLFIAAWGGAVLAVMFGLPVLKPVGRKLFEDPVVADIVTGAVLGISVLVALSIVAHYLNKLIRRTGLTPVDRALGAAFGAARGALVLCLLYILIVESWGGGTSPEWVSEAKSAPLLKKGADRLEAAMPASWREKLTSASKDDDADLKKDEATEPPPEKPADDAAGAAPSQKEEKPKMPGSGGEGYKEDERGGMDKLIEKNDPDVKQKR